MLLQELKLTNIRSYLDQNVLFSEGSTLLSGDIGSGKTTILLAIEFALFGASRPDLPAEALLRKGATQGSVELKFQLEGTEITIRRGLKKEKEGIKQTPGHLIVGNQKKELMPVELKAEILSLLGYPEEFITKNKNYLFRYTVYTPQEEMKFILQEDPEVRLDALRKIFNIDKYRSIRENVQLYLKLMREGMRILETKLEPLEQTRLHAQNLQREQEVLIQSLLMVEPKLRELNQKITLQRETIERTEAEQHQYLELQHRYTNVITLTEEKKKQLLQLKVQEEKVQMEANNLALPTEKDLPTLEKEKKEVELRLNALLRERMAAENKLSFLQQRVQEVRGEIEKTMLLLQALPLKENQFQQLSQEISIKEEFIQKKKHLEDLFAKTVEMITKNNILLTQAKEIKHKIGALNSCPTCLQEVSSEYKLAIADNEDKKIGAAENLLFAFQKQRSIIVEEREGVRKQLEEVTSKENQLTKIKVELQQLKEQQTLLQQRREHLQALTEERENLTLKGQQLQQDKSLEKAQQGLKQVEGIIALLLKKQYMELQQQGIKEEITRLEEYWSTLQRDGSILQTQLQEKKDLSQNIQNDKGVLIELLQQERSFSVQQAELRAQKQALQKQEEQLRQTISALEEQQKILMRRKEIHHWLEEYFLNLTYTIEKQVMANIHSLFNQLFQEWFTILINDENVYSRIDDSFYPIIELNGYEVPFPNLSGGEKTSAALAYRLALNRVINDIIHQIKTKELLILDEPTDGFSSEQLDKVREVLERLNLQQTIIVSHEPKIETFVENIIRVSKEGHVSRVFS